MKSKWKRIALISIIVLIAAGGIIYYFYAIDKDKNGLTKQDVAQAEKALMAYIALRNQGDIEGSLNCLSEFYADELENWRKAYELGSGIILDDFHAEYDIDLSYRHIGYVRGWGSRVAEYKLEAKVIYFSCSFSVVEKQTGSALGSGMEAGEKCVGYGYWLIKENGKWKILTNGY